MGLLTLPVEIQLIVLHHLASPELVRCRAVCKHLRQLVDAGQHFKLVTELGAAGCIDNPDNDEPVSTKVELLNEQVRALACMHWAKRKLMTLADKNSKSKLLNGVYYRLCRTNDQVDDTIISAEHEHDETFVLWDVLPSRRDESCAASMHGFGFLLDDFAVDMSQDMVAGIRHFHEG